MNASKLNQHIEIYRTQRLLLAEYRERLTELKQLYSSLREILREQYWKYASLNRVDARQRRRALWEQISQCQNTLTRLSAALNQLHHERLKQGE